VDVLLGCLEGDTILECVSGVGVTGRVSIPSAVVRMYASTLQAADELGQVAR
jgi:hypothetical protein